MPRSKASWTSRGRWVAASNRAKRRRIGTAMSLPATLRSRKFSTESTPRRIGWDMAASKCSVSRDAPAERVGVTRSAGASRLTEYGFWYFFSLFYALFAALREVVLVLGQVEVEKLQDATTVLVADHVQRLVVLGAFNDPQFLGVAGASKESARHVRLDVGVVGAVDHEERPRSQALKSALKRREVAMAFFLASPHGGKADEAEEPGGNQALNQDVVVIDAEPVAHVRHQRGVNGKDAVGDATTDVRVAGSGKEAGAGAFADAEKADSARVGVGPILQVGHSRLGVAHLVVRNPLQRIVARFGFAVTLASRLEGEDVIAGGE